MRVELTQARKLSEIVSFVSNMTKKGFEIKIDSNGNARGIKRGNIYQADPRLIQGKKAHYSRDFFFVIAGKVFDRNTLQAVDLVA